MNDTSNNVEADQDIQRLRLVRKSISEDQTKIKEYIKLLTSDENVDYSVPLSEIQTLLTMISSSYNIKLETITESFLVKFNNSEEISLQDFLDHLILCLDKQEKIIQSFQTNNDDNINLNLNLNDNSNSNFDNINITEKEKEKKDFDFQEGKITAINLNNLNETEDLYLMILHRSLYILKKKFDLNQEEIKRIYENFSEKNKYNKIIDTEKFVEILDKIFKLCKINFLDIKYPSDLFKAEIVEDYSEEKLNMVERQIKSFMLKSRKNFNDKFKYKKANDFYEKYVSEKSEFAKHNSEPEKNSANVTNANTANAKANKINESSANLNESKISNTKMNETKNSKASKADPKKAVAEKKVTASKKNSIGKAKESSKTINSNNPVSEDEAKNAKIEELNSKLPKFDEKEKENKEETNKNFTNFNKGNFNNPKSNEEANNLVNTLQENKGFNNLDNIENLEDFKKKKLDDEIRSVADMENNNKNKSKKFIISDAIPLIIAEFIHENINIAILDMSDDLKSDLRGLFDKDIIKKIEDGSNYDLDSENALKMKEYLFEKLNTQKNIKTYEDLLLTKKTQGENTNHILHILDKLRHHLAIIERKIRDLQLDNDLSGNNPDNKSLFIDGVLDNSAILNKSLNNNNSTNNLSRNYKSKIIQKKKTKEEIRIDNLQQIFDFYAKQNIFQPKTATFVEIEDNFKIVVLREYVKFANDFNFPLKRDYVVETFKKNAVNGREMRFDGFIKSLEKFAIKLNDEKIKICLNKIKRIRAIGNNLNVKEENPNPVPNTNLNLGNNNPHTYTHTHTHAQHEHIVKETTNQSNTDDKDNITNENALDPKTIQIKSKKKQEASANSNNDLNINTNDENNLNNENSTHFDLGNNSLENNNTETITPNNNKSHVENINTNKNMENPLNNNMSYMDPLEQTNNEITSIRKEIFEMKKKSLPELIEDLYEFMSIDDMKNLQKKMKGYINPFHSDKMTRIEEGQIKGILKFDGATSENVKRILKERREQKQKEQEEKEKLEKLKKEEEKRRLRNKSNENNNNNNKNIYYKEKPKPKYAEIQKKHNNIIKEKETKLTWDQIEHLNFNHFITNREDDFNPNDLFDGANDSDYENIFDVSNIGERQGGNISTSKTRASQISAMNINSTNPINIQMSMNLPQNHINNNSYLMQKGNNNYNDLDTFSDEQNKYVRNQKDRYYDKKNSLMLGSANSNGNNYSKHHERKNSDIYGSIYSNGNGNNNRYNSNYEISRNDSNSNRSNADSDSRTIGSPRNRNSPKRKNSMNNNPKGKNVNNNRNSSRGGNGNINANQIQRNNSPRYNNNNPTPNNKSGNNYQNLYSNNSNNIQKKQIGNIEKTEKLAREMEKNRANKSARLINRNEDMIKKSIDKIKKYL